MCCLCFVLVELPSHKVEESQEKALDTKEQQARRRSNPEKRGALKK